MKKSLLFLVLGSLSVWAQAAPPDEMLTLFNAKNCFTCHALERKVVGPSFADVKATTAKRGTSAEALAAKIQKGGSGVYGSLPMPPNPQLTAQEALRIAQWLTSKD